MNTYFTGQFSLIPVTTPNGLRYIDKNTYLRALLTPVDNITTVEIMPKLDLVTFGGYAVDTCMVLIHYAAFESELAPYKTPVKLITYLPKFLSVIDWVSIRLRPSNAYKKYLKSVKICIQGSINTLRAIVCSDEKIVTSTGEIREHLLIDAQITIPPPKFLELFEGNPNHNTAVNYTYSQFAKLAAYMYPKFGKIEDFGPECARVICSIFKPEELDLHYLGKQVTICDIFIHGLGYILL
jgi:hypothetical protein